MLDWGALLPCYWIYREVGRELLKRGSPIPCTPRWIHAYVVEEFGEVMQAVLDLTDWIGPAKSGR